jgi:hypothetical protein
LARTASTTPARRGVTTTARSWLSLTSPSNRNALVMRTGPAAASRMPLWRSCSSLKRARAAEADAATGALAAAAVGFSSAWPASSA